jgi:hypothetical protein
MALDFSVEPDYTGAMSSVKRRRRPLQEITSPHRDVFLQAAINRIAESDTDFAKKIGASKQALSFWEECPDTRVLQIEFLSRVPRWQLRPDIYPDRPGQRNEQTIDRDGRPGPAVEPVTATERRRVEEQRGPRERTLVRYESHIEFW